MRNMTTMKTSVRKTLGRAAGLAVLAAALSLDAETVPLSETGDLHRPANVTADTPCLLLIHGGGWSAMSRRDVVGIADYFSKDLGFVVYNIDYRLASPEHPWPACGEDCVASAKFMFTEAFARAAGVRPRKIWIVGGSAGGHLALWTGLSLPSDQVAGIVSISGIADPAPDFAALPWRYRVLFGGQEPTAARLDAMNPLRLIRPDGPPVLLTHATDDTVVPIASARNFEKAYRAAGNHVEFYEYPSEIEPGLTGHCIWRPNSKPHRLIAALERAIADFVRPRVSTPQADAVGATADVWSLFANPPASAKSWTYYFWSNTLTDRETITAEVADMARLGFGGILLTDSRGYWDDDDHVLNPPATVRWGSADWLDLVEHTIREADRHGLSLFLNIAASGGHLRGDVDVVDDAPKFLKCRAYLPGDAFEPLPFPHGREVAAFAVRTAEPAARTDWANAGDGQMSMEGNSGKGEDVAAFKRRTALEVRELKSADEGRGLGTKWTILRFARATVVGREQDIDVLDRAAVGRHLDRVVAPLVARLPGLVGRDKAFAGLYNVSWEGLMPTWSATFEADFAADAGYALRPKLPVLAGFVPAGADAEKVFRDFRRARGRMMVTHLYGAVRDWAHAHGMFASAESGGPWNARGQKRDPRTFGECDQFEFLVANDVPQGEFWPTHEALHPDAGRANRNIDFFGRGIVAAARRAKQPIAAVEAFTHMYGHWTVDPAFLKPLADAAFVDGMNRIVWHTYTTSPAKYGVPGLEYFAGTHVNRHVTWNRDAVAFVRYLGRCQALLQAGDRIDDGEFLPPTGNYWEWGRFRRDEGAQFLTTHRRIGAADVFFVTGEGAGEVSLNAVAGGRAVEVWDPVAVTRRTAEASEANGRTQVRLDLPRGGSAFVVFADKPARPLGTDPKNVGTGPVESRVAGPWRVSFRYHPGVAAEPPKARTMERLVDWTSLADVRHFAGTGVYEATFDWADAERGRIRLSLGSVPTGLARVFVNGADCGIAWCAPWEVDVTAAVRLGRNALQIEYTNNWHNRLVGDCALPPEARVTRSTVHYWNVPRRGRDDNPWTLRPTLYSGPSAYDPLQPSGLLGPVRLMAFDGK